MCVGESLKRSDCKNWEQGVAVFVVGVDDFEKMLEGGCVRGHLWRDGILISSMSFCWQVVELSLAVVNPDVHGDALSGLISVLRTQAPGAALLSAVLSQSAKFGRFVAVVTTGWMSTHYSVLLSSLQQLCDEGRFRSEGDEENNGKVGAKRCAVVPPSLAA